MANRSDSSSDGDSSRSTFDEVETSIEELRSDAEDSPKIEGPPSKRSRKVPARFKDSACTPNTTRILEEFDTLIKDSKSTNLTAGSNMTYGLACCNLIVYSYAGYCILACLDFVYLETLCASFIYHPLCVPLQRK